ncbi:conserved hypothetical protein [Clavibacter michiganensis subsp. michiganensis NCPPB 382]|uniref:Glycosyl hydrolases family 43 n=1 Tax=Clavibacter michiganensis subsp. michiganensis (strain NCPPB 382) TaxID=443906 RepID=A5CT49_CLAM3|nr:glycoside hydrolase family 43 protein [Clavibacter michiganensis]CAN02274.1 conserved hypothetical protein [Clavibacter michiganensis subsp. michiganensis NCPPB 382]
MITQPSAPGRGTPAEGEAPSPTRRRGIRALAVTAGLATALSLAGLPAHAATHASAPAAARAAAPAAATPPAPAAVEDATFTPGEARLDTSGEVIQAHGGQIVPSVDEAGDTIYYWYGEDRSNGYASSPGVHVYSSHDLEAWTDEGLALRAMSSPDQFDADPYFAGLYGDLDADARAAVYEDLGTVPAAGSTRPAAILERPKVVHNAATGQWVMWIHTDGPTATSDAQYAKATAGVAVADSPTGPFRYIRDHRLHEAPPGEPDYQPESKGMARDMNLFVDDDGTAYIVYSSEENYSLYISKLDADYTALATGPADAVKGVDFTRPYVGAHREAPVLFKSHGTYYLITSGATGWNPNPASYATATDILGTWTDRGNPAQGDGAGTTFGSQSTSVIPIDPENGRFAYMGDRWTPDDLANAPYIWLPLSFGEGGSMTLANPGTWSVRDIPAYAPWEVTTAIPATVRADDASALPTEVDVTTGGTTTTTGITWDAAALAGAGPVQLRGTLDDGRTLVRRVVVVPRDLEYAVDAGGWATADWTAIVAASAADGPLLGSVPEQPLGADPATGATWGWTGSSDVKGDATGDLYSTLRWAKSGATLTYSFGGLTPGEHRVDLGFSDPWTTASRAARITLNGQVVETARPFGADSSSAYTATVGADGVLRVEIAKAAGPDIQVSFLMVSGGPAALAAQTIAFTAPTGATAGGDAIALTATATSGLPVSFQASGACTVTGTRLSPTSAGVCTITATQAGDDEFAPAESITRTFRVQAAVLDDFGRRGSAVGGSWTGDTAATAYRLAAGTLRPYQGGALLRPEVLGATQEASVTLTKVARTARSVGLVLKAQSARTVDRGAITVTYDARTKAITTTAIATDGTRTAYPAIPVRLLPGDVLTARYTADDTVEIQLGDDLVGTRELSDADAARFHDATGRVGVWTQGALLTVLDDVRGGTTID